MLPGIGFVIVGFAIVGHVHISVPGFEALQHFITLRQACPHRLPLLQTNFVRAFAHAVFLAALVWRGADPHHAIERNVLVINPTKNRHI
jgi:hypothetical protein